MTTTLRDFMRFTVPPESRLLTGDESLATPVRGVATLRATLPAFPELRSGDVALIAPDQARALDDRLTLPHIISRLVEVPVAAIAALGPLDEAVAAQAREAGLPLIELPAETDLRVVERDLQRLIVDPDLQIERWASHLYSDLTQRIVDGVGVDGVLNRLAGWSGASAAYYSMQGRLRAFHADEPARLVFELLRPDSSGQRRLLNMDVHVELINNTGWLALARSELDQWDALAAHQGASALALELAKERAVKDAEARVRGDLVRTILSGTPVDSQSLRGQAAELGYQLDLPHLALVVSSANHEPSAGLQSLIEHTLRQRNLTVPVLVREDTILVFMPVPQTTSSAYDLIDILQQSQPITAGISNTASSATQWARALDEAEQALTLGRRLFGEGSVTAFADLGVYRLLLALRDSSELWRFYRDTLGALVDHGSTGAILIETLEGYFLARGNVSRAAALLHLHRNTLIYRLQRICEITGVDWERAEDQLALQLALKVHRVLGMTNTHSPSLLHAEQGGRIKDAVVHAKD